MSCLTIHADACPGAPVARTEDPAEIAALLAGIGVRFERWSLPGGPPPADAPDGAILAAYRPHLDQLMGGAAGSADVVRLTPGHPQAAALRAKFLDEHTHTEDEIRFFVRGCGNFVLHVDGRVLDAHCAANDLIAIPAHVPHWFDAGPEPDFTVLRVFTDEKGWVPHFTGHALAARFPAAR